MRSRYYGLIDGQILRMFWTRSAAERWASLRPEATIVPASEFDALAGAEPAVF